jgi:hypothetical protein
MTIALITFNLIVLVEKRLPQCSFFPIAFLHSA